MPGAEDATSTGSHKRDGAGKVNRSIGGHSLSSNLRVASLDVEGDEKVLVEFDDAPEPPDGGWGWVVCFACFMGTPLGFMNYHFERKFADSHFHHRAYDQQIHVSKKIIIFTFFLLTRLMTFSKNLRRHFSEIFFSKSEEFGQDMHQVNIVERSHERDG